MASHRVTAHQLDELYVAIDEFLRREPLVKAPALRTVHRAWRLDAEVSNGGFAQFFWNCPDTRAPRPTRVDRILNRTPVGTSPAQEAGQALRRLGIKDGAVLLAQARKRLDADEKEKKQFHREPFFKGTTRVRQDLVPLSDAWFKLRPSARSRINHGLVDLLERDVTLLAAVVGGAKWLVARRLGIRGARVDRIIEGHTPLEWATRANQHEVVAWLLEHGADPNRVGFNTVRPIHHAAMHGARESAERLLAAGADPTAGVPDWGDLDAVDLARRYDHVELATRLSRASPRRSGRSRR